jgi:hypothetical protein
VTSSNLDRLVAIGKLKEEPFDQAEFDGLVKSGRARLSDAQIDGLALESRFDLAYNASHALALAALRRRGYRSDNRYLVFQCLEITLGMEPAYWRVLALGHERRNVAEYEGHLDVEAQLVAGIIAVAELVYQMLTDSGNWS